MDVKFPTNNIATFEALLKSTEAEMKKAIGSPPYELVAVRSKAGGFEMKRQRVGIHDIYHFIQK